MILSTQEKKDWFRLLACDRIGPVTFHQMLSFFGSAGEALKHVNEFARRGGGQNIPVPSEKLADAQMARAESVGAALLFSAEANYPLRLKQLIDRPPILFTIGQQDFLSRRSLAIVGTRHASVNGKNLARHFALGMAEHDYIVVSGLASGIDRAAHIGALNAPAGKGGTVAVLGTAVDEVYPKENEDVYLKIKEQGCLISEFSFGTRLNARNFPRRNRIISGLSQGVLVIEAQEKSGSLITAREGLAQGREVMAVPGSPIDPRSTGPNSLIKDGAALITTLEDILNALQNVPSRTLCESAESVHFQPTFHISDDVLNDARRIILDNLGSEMTSVDLLVRSTGIDPQTVNVILVELELAGRLERASGNRVSLIYGME